MQQQLQEVVVQQAATVTTTVQEARDLATEEAAEDLVEVVDLAETGIAEGNDVDVDEAEAMADDQRTRQLRISKMPLLLREPPSRPQWPR